MAKMASPVSMDGYIAESLAASSDLSNARAMRNSHPSAKAHDLDANAIQPVPPPRVYARESYSGRNSPSRTTSRPVSVHTTESSSGITYEDEIRYRTVSKYIVFPSGILDLTAS